MSDRFFKISCNRQSKLFFKNGLFQKKIHTPLTDGKLEILAGAGLIAQEIQVGGGI